ncbi:LysR substrate-binding domain-containing protein [Variovorax sp. VNK109]|jgi:DNA-binding transcriptional LysR family regulator|uniref:LysR substrate-binding domain-containing protein n=1 Tax=Variovorax sp. VNK109 TaxID=3400919 RepID=UPI003C002D65
MDIIKALEDFNAVAQCRSFSRAADARYITQSAISRRIQGLENWLGLELIDRQQSPIDLTPEGKMFRDEVIPLLHELNHVCASLRNKGGEAGTLSISAVHALCIDLMPRWIKEMRHVFPELHARLDAVNLEGAIDDLMRGRSHVLACYAHSRLSNALSTDRFQHVTLGHDRLVPVCRSNARGQPIFSLELDEAVPYLAYTQDTFLARAVDFMLALAPSQPKFVRNAESSMAEVLKRMALQGAGVAWLPRGCVENDIAPSRLAIINGQHWRLPLDIRLYRMAGSRHRLLDELWQHLRRTEISGLSSEMLAGLANS